ncbi:tetratricopeptide repeat protein [Bdellovibrio sp. HCB337]|uniref:tetratricopeptide repeat protein n=1 Tax=Bdellovibrio sp. HCB337 TaxID=3394358 RepID=UPI0039A6E529
MSTKLSKEDVKSPDQVLKTLNQGFQWSQSHSKALIAGLIAFAVIGIGYSIFSNMAERKETQAQEAYFKFEKSYLDKKRDFEEAERNATRPPVKDAKDQPAPKAKASGDMDKDYGSEVAGFKQVMDSHPTSKAAQMAALNLSEIYMNYKKTDDASATLQKVAGQSGGKDLISFIVLSQYGNVLSEKDDCKGAVDQWSKVLSRSEAGFLHDTLRIKSAFCYEKLNDFAKAEELYKKVSQNSQDPKNPQAGEVGLGKDAEKYLRLLKLKQNAG